MTDRQSKRRLQGTSFDLPFQEFAPVSRELMRAYVRLIAEGAAEGAIATAMLGATINLYRALDLTEDLPSLLRALAERLEHEDELKVEILPN